MIEWIVERVERLEEEKKEVAEQIKEVFAEAKANGFDTKTLRKVERELIAYVVSDINDCHY